jgi:hypothetical protein
MLSKAPQDMLLGFSSFRGIQLLDVLKANRQM